MDSAVFKKMYRLIDNRRRFYLVSAHKEQKELTAKQLNHLMWIRLALPCDLAQVMNLTGLSSSAASIFIEKMVCSGMLTRKDDPVDRRHIKICATEKTRQLFEKIDGQLDRWIDDHLKTCTAEEIQLIGAASALVCRKIEDLAEYDNKNQGCRGL